MKYLMILFFACTSVQAKIQREGDTILPFSNSKYPLQQLIRDYAEAMQVTVIFEDKLVRPGDTVHVQLSRSMSTQELKDLFYSTLNFANLTAVEENDLVWLYNARDIRYLSTKVYSDDSYPKNNSYSTVLMQLKHPLSSTIARNLRPILSRYGRVIDFSDGKTILFSDLGTNIERIKKTVETMDTPDAFQNLLKQEPKPEDGPNPLKEKTLELEMENEMLKKKLMELKEKQQ